MALHREGKGHPGKRGKPMDSNAAGKGAAKKVVPKKAKAGKKSAD